MCYHAINNLWSYANCVGFFFKCRTTSTNQRRACGPYPPLMFKGTIYTIIKNMSSNYGRFLVWTVSFEHKETHMYSDQRCVLVRARMLWYRKNTVMSFEWFEPPRCNHVPPPQVPWVTLGVFPNLWTYLNCNWAKCLPRETNKVTLAFSVTAATLIPGPCTLINVAIWYIEPELALS